MYFYSDLVARCVMSTLEGIVFIYYAITARRFILGQAYRKQQT